jgi:hypothetical protein
MPWTKRQVRFLESKDSPLTSSQREKMNSELHDNPSMGHMKKGAKGMERGNKVEAYKKSKRKAHRIHIEKADDDSGFMVTTHYPGPIDGSSHGALISDASEKSVHRNLSSVHRHLRDKFGGSGPHKGE